MEFETVDFRAFTLDRHNHVDDTPCGGGQGMVLSCQPIVDCLKSVRSEDSFVIMMTPQGNRFDQKLAHRFASEIKHLIILCGHYEGFDERIRSFVDMEVSLGDFVLTGGEGAALVISDAVIRLLDHVIKEESHSVILLKTVCWNIRNIPVPSNMRECGYRMFTEWSSCQYPQMAAKGIVEENDGETSGFIKKS